MSKEKKNKSEKGSTPEEGELKSETTPESNEEIEPEVLPTDEEESDSEDKSKGDQEEDESLNERYLRLRADFANFRRRVKRERADMFARSNELMMSELLPVIDHFEMGLKTASEHHSDKAVIDGFEMVYEQLSASLAKFNLEPIDAIGKKFNPHLHEAINHMPSDEYDEEVVSHQIRRGYMLGEKLLRPTQVIVSSGSADAEKNDSPKGNKDQ